MVKVHLDDALIVPEKKKKIVNKDQQRDPIKIGPLKISKMQKTKSISRKKGVNKFV